MNCFGLIEWYAGEMRLHGELCIAGNAYILTLEALTVRDLLVVLGGEVPSGRAVARMLRAEHYSCLLMPSSAQVADVAKETPAGIIIAGELPEGATAPSVSLLEVGVPVLALGSASHALLQVLGEPQHRKITKEAVAVEYIQIPLFEDVSAGERWIESALPYALPDRYRVIAHGNGCPLAYGDEATNSYLLQFQMERNDPDGISMLLSFAGTICGCTPWWTADSIIANAENLLRTTVGKRSAICAMSGGLDSTVAAVLAKRVLGNQILCVFVDTGLLREGESESIVNYFRDDLALPFARIDASRRIIHALAGVTSPGEKRRIVEDEILRALQEKADQLPGETVFVKGTHYLDAPDKQGLENGRANTIVTPLRDLFKDEIRKIGEYLQLSPQVIGRQPFPGMGLAARIRGSVSEECLHVLRNADAIFESELQDAGLHKRLKRYFAILDTIDDRLVIVLRATQGSELKMSPARLPYDVLERTVERLQREIQGISHVVYDMTPGVAEWQL